MLTLRLDSPIARCVEDEGAFPGDLTFIPSDTTKQTIPDNSKVKLLWIGQMRM